MKCPRCQSVVLDERERDGIQVDACPTCRGVWLDRGELERLVAAATRAIDAEVAARAGAAASPSHFQASHAQGHPQPARPPHRRDDDDDDDDDHHDHGRFARDGRRGPEDREEPPRRRGWLQVFDIFD